VARPAPAILILLGLPAMLAAQAIDPRAVQPERPTVATHAHTVAPGIVEVETGVEADRFNDHSHALGVPTNVKLGLAGHAQLNIYVPFMGGDVSSLGIGDVGAGVKWRLLDHHPVLGDFAILPIVKLPSGSQASGRGTGTTDVSAILISSHTLGSVTMDLNVGHTWRSGDGTLAPKQAWLWTASFGVPVKGRLGWVLEYFGYPATSGAAATEAYSAILSGPTFAVNPRVMLDAGVIVPFAGQQTYALYAGLVFHAGRIWRAGAP